MSKRTKVFLIALAIAAGIAAIFGKGGSAFFVKLALLAFLVWLGWRAFALLWRLFRPVRNVIMPAADETLRNVGFGKIADAGQRFNSQIDKATGRESGSKQNP